LRQSYVRRAVVPHLAANPPLSLVFAISDPPWVDTADGAAVRIAMTVGAKGPKAGGLIPVAQGRRAGGSIHARVFGTTTRRGRINADLTVGVDVTQTLPLKANLELCSVGMKTIGAAFQIDEERARQIGLGSVPGLERHIRPYVNGRDVSQVPRGLYVVD